MRIVFNTTVEFRTETSALCQENAEVRKCQNESLAKQTYTGDDLKFVESLHCSKIAIDGRFPPLEDFKLADFKFNLQEMHELCGCPK